MKNTKPYIFLVLIIISCNFSRTKEEINNESTLVYFEAVSENQDDYIEINDSRIKSIQTINSTCVPQNIQLLIIENKKGLSAGWNISTYDKANRIIIDNINLKSLEIYKSVLLDNNVECKLIFVESANKLIKNIESIKITSSGKIFKEPINHNQNIIFEKLPTINEFVHIEPDSTIISFIEKKGIEANTFCFKFKITSPQECGTEFKKYNQQYDSNKIELDEKGESYFILTEENLELELNEYEPGCFDEIMNLKRKYHR